MSILSLYKILSCWGLNSLKVESLGKVANVMKSWCCPAFCSRKPSSSIAVCIIDCSEVIMLSCIFCSPDPFRQLKHRRMRFVPTRLVTNWMVFLEYKNGRIIIKHFNNAHETLSLHLQGIITLFQLFASIDDLILWAKFCWISSGKMVFHFLWYFRNHAKMAAILKRVYFCQLSQIWMIWSSKSCTFMLRYAL